MNEAKIVADQTTNSTDKCNDTYFRYYPLLSFVSLIFTASILGWLFWFARYGFDFVDESYYLNWMARPFNYSVSSYTVRVYVPPSLQTG